MKGIDFQDRDVSTDRGALDDLQHLGHMTTPVIVINGETVVGFDQARIVALLSNG